MKTIADIIFKYSIGIIIVIQVPARIATPSTIAKASIAPIKSWRCFFVFEDKSNIEICVLSPNSATAIAINGIMKSSMILYHHSIFL